MSCIGVSVVDRHRVTRISKSLLVAALIVVSIAGSTAGQDPEASPKTKVVILKKGEIEFTEIHSTEKDKKNAVQVFRRSVREREKLVYVKFDFLSRRCSLVDGALGEPVYVVGRVREDFESGSLLLDTMSAKPTVADASRSDSKPLGSQWQREKDRLEEFAKAQLQKVGYLPEDVQLGSVSEFFSLEDFKPVSGGVCIRRADLSLEYSMWSKVATIAAPGQPLPAWSHYIDARIPGFADERELNVGISLDDVLMRYRSGDPFSVERFRESDYVSITYDRFIVRRMLVDPARGYLPVYSADFRGGTGDGKTATVVYRPKTQSWMEPEKVGEHWMPKRVRVWHPHMLTDIEFKWWDVSKTVPADAFSIAACNLPVGTRLLDKRQVPPVVSVIPATAE